MSGEKVIQFNYGLSRWNLFPDCPSRCSFFWKGVLNCLPAFRFGISHIVKDGDKTLFWKDCSLICLALMYVWPEEFRVSRQPNGSVCELSHLLESAPFSDYQDTSLFLDRIRGHNGELGDEKRWCLTGNGVFSVKSFYNFLNDGGLRCQVPKFFWRTACPRKINLFNWLAWKNKIPTLANLSKRRCNRLPTATCVMCSTGIETVDHRFLECPFVNSIWSYFIQLLQLPNPPSSMSSLWTSWRVLVNPHLGAWGPFC